MHTVTLSLALSLSLTHTHTHAHSPFHTTMLPNLFPFEGSTPPVKGTRRASQPQMGGAAVGGAQQVVTADVETSSRRSATRSATRSPERQGEEGALVNGRYTL